MEIAKYQNAYTLVDCANTSFKFSKIKSDSHPTNKSITLSNGELKIHKQHRWYEGSVSVCERRSLEGFQNFLKDVEVTDTFTLGCINQHENWFDGADIEWVEYGDRKPPDDRDTSVYHHSRITDFFKFMEGVPSLILFAVVGTVGSLESALNNLRQIDPALKNSALLVVPSNTGHISEESTGEQLVGEDGYHIYALVKNGADIPRYGDVFTKRAWLLGHGWIEALERGEYVQRQLVNQDAFSPGFAIDEAPVNLREGLIQDRPDTMIIPGDLLDTSRLPDLDQEELADYLHVVEEAKYDKAFETVFDSGHCIEPRKTAEAYRSETIRLTETYV